MFNDSQIALFLYTRAKAIKAGGGTGINNHIATYKYLNVIAKLYTLSKIAQHYSISMRQLFLEFLTLVKTLLDTHKVQRVPGSGLIQQIASSWLKLSHYSRV